MKILEAVPKDVYLKVEISLVQVKQLLDFFDHCVVQFDKEQEPNMVLADHYVKKELIPTLDQAYEEIKETTNVS